ncbi:MAG TPA: RsmG family class I SAM-dependent methyltransferase [Vicinamibacterales bacterium]|jgi:16S rRNA (guanine527-N7)-methyltransferase
MARDFIEKLEKRCALSNVALPRAAVESLAVYFDLLAKWNARINLTSLQLTPLADEALDRLFVEPLAALPYVPAESVNWFDLGSGGGSPALPLKIGWGLGALTMVEVKARKAAFLREVLRRLNLQGACVEHGRFEDVARDHRGTAHLVTVRAVRSDATLNSAVVDLLGFEGRLLTFVSSPAPAKLPGLEHLETVLLLKGRSSYLSVYRRLVPRGTSLT